MNKKKRLIILVCVFSIVIGFIASPLFPYLRSLSLMSVYSNYCEKNSLLETEKIELKMPSGENWYPFVMTFNADSSFSAYSNTPDTKLTILYNFPAFSLMKGCSGLFDEASPYYNSFYGAYLVQREDKVPYGFSSDTLALSSEAVSSVARFDFFNLVLSEFGLSEEDEIFDYSVTSKETDLTFAGSDNWTRVSSNITVNGMAHQKNGFVTSYLQYGSPNFPVSSDFSAVKMKSIIYGKYFEEWNTSVFFYVMSPSETVCEDCEKLILSRSTLKSSD